MYTHKHLLSILDSTQIRNTADDRGCLMLEHQTSAVSKKRDSSLVDGVLTLKNSNDQQYTREHAGKWLANYKMSVQSASELIQSTIIGLPGWTGVSGCHVKKCSMIVPSEKDKFSFPSLSSVYSNSILPCRHVSTARTINSLIKISETLLQGTKLP